MAIMISAANDPHFGDTEHTRGFKAVWKRQGETRWTDCLDWIADGFGSGNYANLYRPTVEEAKGAAREWVRKQIRRGKIKP